MVFVEILKIITFYHFDSDPRRPRFPPFLLYVRCKFGGHFCTEVFPCCLRATRRMPTLVSTLLSGLAYVHVYLGLNPLRQARFYPQAKW